MLFEGWELQFTDAWKYHPFHGPNNVNGIDADPDGRGLLYNQLRDDPMGKKVLALQEAYLRKVVDTVNDLDNVLYEVCNEAGAVLDGVAISRHRLHPSSTRPASRSGTRWE